MPRTYRKETTMHIEKPDRKVGLGTALGIPLGMIAAWLIGLTGVVVPPEIAGAIGASITGVIAYFVPNQ